MAFGTGEHGTTRGALRFLEQIVKSGDRVLDVGTGSAILAIGTAVPVVAAVLAPELPTVLLAALAGIAATAVGSPAGARLLRRIDLRVPIRG